MHPQNDDEEEDQDQAERDTYAIRFRDGDKILLFVHRLQRDGEFLVALDEGEVVGTFAMEEISGWWKTVDQVAS